MDFKNIFISILGMAVLTFSSVIVLNLLGVNPNVLAPIIAFVVFNAVSIYKEYVIDMGKFGENYSEKAIKDSYSRGILSLIYMILWLSFKLEMI